MDNNKSLSEIRNLYHALRESMRHTLSRILMDTSEEKPMDVYICAEESCGVSDSLLSHITQIFQQPGEGIIWVKYENDDDFIEFDELSTETILKIVEELC